MLYSNVRKSGVMGRKMHKLLRWLGPEAELPPVKTFKSTDAALEYAENELLKRLGYVPDSDPACRARAKRDLPAAAPAGHGRPCGR